METNKINISLIDDKARLGLALKAAHMGVWEFNVVANHRRLQSIRSRSK